MSRQSKISKPKVRDLKDILSGLITASLSKRIDALAEAMQWYDNAIDFVIKKGQFDPNTTAKLMEKSRKTRELGIKTNHPEEKELSFKQTVGIMQKICSMLKPPPVEKYYAKYQSMKGKLETEGENANRKFSRILEIMNQLFPEAGIKFSVDPRSSDPRKYDGTGEIIYSKHSMKEMWTLYRQEGVLALAFKEIMFLARAKATVPDGAGGFMRDHKLEIKAINELHQSIIKYARTDAAPTRLVKHPVIYIAPTTQQVSTQSTVEKPKVSRVGFGKKKEAGKPYASGSAMDILWTRLSNGHEITKKELFDKVPTHNPEDRLKWIIKHGPQKGWSVSVNGDKVKMTINQ